MSLREAEVARCGAAGFTNSQIADRLCMSEKTAKTHVASIFRKVQFHHRLQLAPYTLEKESLQHELSKQQEPE